MTTTASITDTLRAAYESDACPAGVAITTPTNLYWEGPVNYEITLSAYEEGGEAFARVTMWLGTEKCRTKAMPLDRAVASFFRLVRKYAAWAAE